MVDSAALRCPACGEEEDLRGQPAEEGIRITCSPCGATWLRDTTPRCATCGADQIVQRPRTLTQFSRGTQMSVLGWQDVPMCVSCDHEALLKSAQARAPLPAGYRPAALYRRPEAGDPGNRL